MTPSKNAIDHAHRLVGGRRDTTALARARADLSVTTRWLRELRRPETMTRREA